MTFLFAFLFTGALIYPKVKFSFPFNVLIYPVASIEGPTTGRAGSTLNYKVSVKSPGVNRQESSVYWGYVVESGYQDSWYPIKKVTLPEGDGEYDVSLSLNSGGTYWIMVNVGDNREIEKNACTGNPSYSKAELANIGLASCGPNSYIEVQIEGQNVPSKPNFY